MGDRTPRRRHAVLLAVALLFGLCATLTPALFSSAPTLPASPAKAEMAMAGAACPLLRPGPTPRMDNAESKPLPSAAMPADAAAGGPAAGWWGLPRAGATPAALGRFTRDGRAPPYALI